MKIYKNLRNSRCISYKKNSPETEKKENKILIIYSSNCCIILCIELVKVITPTMRHHTSHFPVYKLY